MNVDNEIFNFMMNREPLFNHKTTDCDIIRLISPNMLTRASYDEYNKLAKEEQPVVVEPPPVVVDPPVVNVEPQTKLCEEEPPVSSELASTSIFDNINDWIMPKQKDTLFWCVFIATQGYTEYMKIHHNYGAKELEMKQKISNYIGKNAGKMKLTNQKITKQAVQEIMSELFTDIQKTSLLTLTALGVFFNINFILLNTNKMGRLEIVTNIDREPMDPTYCIKRNKYGKYSIYIEPVNASIYSELDEKTVCLESHTKPLKSATRYKLDELVEIARKLDVRSLPATYKKIDVYTAIHELVKWD
jgi:hypothetical protein